MLYLPPFLLFPPALPRRRRRSGGERNREREREASALVQGQRQKHRPDLPAGSEGDAAAQEPRQIQNPIPTSRGLSSRSLLPHGPLQLDEGRQRKTGRFR